MPPVIIDFEKNIVSQRHPTVPTTSYQMTVADFENVIKTSVTPVEMSPLLPRNTRLYAKQGPYLYYVVELLPGMYPIVMAGEGGNPDDRIFTGRYDRYGARIYRRRGQHGVNSKYAMPWQYFMFRFKKAPQNRYDIDWHMDMVRLAWSRRPITGWNDSLCAPLVPNTYVDGNICLGDSIPESKADPVERVNQLVTSFYTPDSQFNYDLELRPAYGSLVTWRRESAKNPLCWREWNELLRPNLNIRSMLGIREPNPSLGLQYIVLENGRGVYTEEEEKPIVETNQPVTVGQAEFAFAQLAESARQLEEQLQTLVPEPDEEEPEDSFDETVQCDCASCTAAREQEPWDIDRQTRITQPTVYFPLGEANP